MNDYELTNTPFINKKYTEYINVYHKYPIMFNPYNKSEISNYAPTLTANCGNICSSGAILITEIDYGKIF